MSNQDECPPRRRGETFSTGVHSKKWLSGAWCGLEDYADFISNSSEQDQEALFVTIESSGLPAKEVYIEGLGSLWFFGTTKALGNLSSMFSELDLVNPPQDKKKRRKRLRELFDKKFPNLGLRVPSGPHKGHPILFSRCWWLSRHCLRASSAVCLALTTSYVPLFHSMKIVCSHREIGRKMVHSRFPKWALFLSYLEQGKSCPSELELIRWFKNGLLNNFTRTIYPTSELGLCPLHEDFLSKEVDDIRDWAQNMRSDCDHYCSMVEEAPLSGEIFLPEIRPLPPDNEAKYRQIFRNDSNPRKRAIRLSYSILQSKSIFASVPTSFVDHAIGEHGRVICTPEDRPPLEPVLVETLTRVGREFGQRLRDHYNPHQTVVPSSRASFDYPRSKGGKIQELRDNGRFQKIDGPRMEPYVVGLFGNPGSGKTLSIRRFVDVFRRELGLDELQWDELTYSRSTSLKHWDGYVGQPIVIIDDWGQDFTDPSDIREFDTLVSPNTYYVPMADLKNKGIPFTSPIIILTSNRPFGAPLLGPSKEPIVVDPFSVWRRISLPVYLPGRTSLSTLSKSGERTWQFLDPVIYGFDPPPKGGTRTYEPGENSFYVDRSKLHTSTGVGVSGGPEYDPRVYFSRAVSVTPPIRSSPTTFTHLLHKCIVDFRKKVQFDLHESGWHQQVQKTAFKEYPPGLVLGSNNLSREKTQEEHLTVDFPVYTPGVYYFQQNAMGPYRYEDSITFPKEPPPGRPTARVVPILEALKVRTITVGSADSLCLKPLQMAMLDTLRTYPQFYLTCGRDYSVGLTDDEHPEGLDAVYSCLSRLFDSPCGEGEFNLSGDYKNATDNFRLEVTKILLESILESIDHTPTRLWARWECGGSELCYPGQVWRSQERGQLMGSILSFPLLCLANYALCVASGFDMDKTIINGDDVGSRVNLDQVQKWKTLGQNLGLEPSPGKYVLSKEIILLNSQMYFTDTLLGVAQSESFHSKGGLTPEQFKSCIPYTGKLSLASRRDLPLAETLYLFQEFYPGERCRMLYIDINQDRIRSTPRDPFVPQAYGGLARTFSPRGCFDTQRARKVYSALFYRSVCSIPIPLVGAGPEILQAVRLPFVKKEFGGEAMPPIVRAALTHQQMLGMRRDPTEDLLAGDYDWLSFQEDFEKSRKAGIWKVVKKAKRLQDLIPLTYLQSSWVILPKSKVATSQKRILRYLLENERWKRKGKDEEELTDLVDLWDVDTEPTDECEEENFSWFLQLMTSRSQPKDFQVDLFSFQSELVPPGVYRPAFPSFWDG